MINLLVIGQISVDKDNSSKTRSSSTSTQLDHSSENENVVWSELRSNEDLSSLPKDSGYFFCFYKKNMDFNMEH